MDLSVIGIIASLLFIVVLALRGWHIILIAPMAVIVTALFSGMEILPLLTGAYMKGFVSYASKFYLVFLAASIFGKVMEDSGAARSIALGILRVIGRDSRYKVLLAVAAITLALCGDLRRDPHCEAAVPGAGCSVAPLCSRLHVRHGLHHDDHDPGDAVDHQHHADEVYGFVDGLGSTTRAPGGRSPGGVQPLVSAIRTGARDGPGRRIQRA